MTTVASSASSDTGRSSTFRVHRLSLAFFDPGDESEFLQQYGLANLRHWRICHVLAVAFYSAYVVIHAVTIPAKASAFYAIGFGVVAPMFLAGILLTYRQWFRIRWQAINTIYFLVTGAGALGMASAAGDDHSFFTLTGFLFCFLFGYAVIRLRFAHASVAGAVLTLAFLARAPSLLGTDAAAYSLGILYVVGFNALGMLIAYYAELHTRREFHTRSLLEAEKLRVEQEKARVKEINTSLEVRVQERTRELAEKNHALEEEIRRSQCLERERDTLEEQYRQAQKMETVGRLAGGIAHDFNNLVTIINSYAEFADEGLRDGDPLKSDLRQIKDAGKRAADLTRQLLAFSRKQVMEPKVLDLNKVVASLDSMIRRLIGEDIELVTVLGRQLGTVKADPGQLEQVLMNLAVNARDAMPQGGKLTIETANVDLDEEYASTHADTVAGPFVMLALTDTGAGMSAEVRQQIFEPFFTTKEKGRGTGLGLATVYGIVKQSGGNIWVYSEPDQGTTFKVYLPRAMDEQLQPAASTVEVRELRGNETVLVVEDEPAVRELACRILKSAGYRPISAANGGEALLECERHAGKVDLVLTDVVMPKMSGKELAERLEKLSPGLRVLYMSGYTDNAIVHHGVLDAGTHFIAKPFNGPDLLRKVRMVLEAGGQ